jgi:photosystem II stability/assembly factor-like uncharacterized protein
MLTSALLLLPRIVVSVALTAAVLRAFVIAATAATAAPPSPHMPPRWTKMPLLPPEAAKAGVFPGGEGCQWPRGPVVIAPSAPNFLLLPIDVGGLYRSLDGGKLWQQASVGWNARGANHFAIDPRNPRRVLGVAGNSLDWGENWGPSPHGVYLSTNQAASWKHVLAAREGIGGAVAYDPTSFDRSKGFCTVAYFLSARSGLFRSEDGGATWKNVARGDAVLGRLDRGGTQGGTVNSALKVDARTGALYVGGGKGLYRSADGGKTWETLRGHEIYGLDLAPNGTVFISGTDGILVSRDSGRHFFPPPARGLDQQNGKPVNHVTVSPADTRRMTAWVAGDNWNWRRYVSHDGGNTFALVKIENGLAGRGLGPNTVPGGLAPMPYNVRQGYFAWDPKNPNVVYGLGGDWVTKSSDGGRTFRWSNNGYNGVMLGGLFNFSVHAPNTVFLAFQDYNGAFTRDGGKTWNYRDVSGHGWGGHCYGGHAVDGQVMFYGDAEGWGTPRRLRISRDGGSTWAFVNGPDNKPLELKGPDVSHSDPTNPHVLFAADLRSTDKGQTWARMDGCEGVFTHDPATKALYGKKSDAVVRSTDRGATWTRIADVPGGFSDLAVDHQSGRIYVASEERLKMHENNRWTTIETPRDQYGNVRVTTVAVDPQAPSVLYVGGPRNTYASHATVCRSTDGGKTWRNLTVTAPLLGRGMADDGPHEVAAIRVHPITRHAWVNGQCYGMWRIAPPRASGETGTSAAQASAPRAVPPPDAGTLVAAAGGTAPGTLTRLGRLGWSCPSD